MNTTQNKPGLTDKNTTQNKPGLIDKNTIPRPLDEHKDPSEYVIVNTHYRTSKYFLIVCFYFLRM